MTHVTLDLRVALPMVPGSLPVSTTTFCRLHNPRAGLRF